MLTPTCGVQARDVQTITAATTIMRQEETISTTPRRSRLPQWWVAFVIVLSACRAQLPEPEVAKHPPAAYVPVPYPPPPARPEFVPEQPDRAALWIDGEWRLRGVRWVWIYGRWVKPPKPDAAFARWDWKRTRDGRLWIAPGRWRDENGRPLAHPSALRLANASEGDRVDDEGRLIDVGANDRARRVKPPPRTTDCEIKKPLATK